MQVYSAFRKNQLSSCVLLYNDRHDILGVKKAGWRIEFMISSHFCREKKNIGCDSVVGDFMNMQNMPEKINKK